MRHVQGFRLRGELFRAGCGLRLISSLGAWPLFRSGLGRRVFLEDGWHEVRVAEVPEEEREDVGPVGDLLVDGVGDAGASVVIDAEENGASAGGVGLKARGHFGSLPGIAPRVVCARGDEGGWIFW